MLRLWIVIATVVIGSIAALSSAETTGRIAGRVIDESGGALTGIAVEARSPSLQGARATVTDSDGRFRLSALPPGLYALAASRPGFTRAERMVTVGLDSTATADFTLRASATEELTVLGEAPPLDFSSTTTGTAYTSDVISRLPTARNYADIVRLNPGVGTDGGDTQGRLLPLTVYGATSAENQWVIDGVNTTHVLKGIQGKAINNEFVQEVEVLTGGYQPEYGGALGGVINAVTKSGGNQFHGGAFLYYDSTGTTAQQVFGPGDSAVAEMRVTEGQRLDYGVDLGGFILKDRLWFFLAYDGVDSRGHVARVAPTRDVSTDDRFPLDARGRLYSAKLTWNATASTTVVASALADPSTSSGAAGSDPGQGLDNVAPVVSLDPSTWSTNRRIGGTDFAVRMTQLFGSRAVVTLEGSLHHDRYRLTGVDSIRYEDQTCVGGTPEAPCDFPPEPNSITGGFAGASGQGDYNSSTRRQFLGDVTLYAGSHKLKAGGAYQDGRTDGLGFFGGGQGVAIRNEYGQPYYVHRFVAVSVDDPTPVVGYAPHAQGSDYGVYVQDSWKAAPGLTLNLGLRWDGTHQENFLGDAVLEPRGGWQPRVGVIWDPWRDGRTKLYAFTGRFSYALPSSAVFGVWHGYTILATYNFDPVSVVQDPSVINHPDQDLRTGGGTFGDPVDQGLSAMYQDELTVGVERMLDPTLSVSLKGTVRRLGSAIEERCDFVPTDGNEGCSIINPGSGGRYARGGAPTCNGLDEPFNDCSESGPASPPARRLYRGVEVLARKVFGDRHWLQASYVYSSLRGNDSGGLIGGAFVYPALWHNGYGALDLDRAQRFRLDGYWTTPWRLAVGLGAFVESGAPLNRLGYFNGDFGSAILLVPRGSAGRLPTLWEANLGLSYPIAVGPAKVTLQAELFNLFNNQIATSRDEAWSTNPPAGYPDTIYDPNQEQDNPNYGLVTSRSAPRSLRFAVRVAF
jgi:hypothetical protein